MNYNTKRLLVTLRKFLRDPQKRKDALILSGIGAAGTWGMANAYDAVHGPKGDRFAPDPEYLESIKTEPIEEPITSNFSNEDLYAALLTGGLGAGLGALMSSKNRGTGAFIGGLAGGSLPLLHRLYKDNYANK